MLILGLAVLAVLLASALCSGSEAALFSVPMVKVRQLAAEKRRGSTALFQIRDNMTRPIATIVIFNNVANIVGSIAVGALAADVLGNNMVGLFSAVLTTLVILFSEIIPKTLGERYSEQISLLVAAPILALSWLLTPILWLLELATSPLTAGGNSFSTNEAEIRLLAKLGQKEGIIEKDESEMIQRVFDLNDRTASDLMTPRVMITWLRGDASLKEERETILASTHSRFIVGEETVDQILGVVLKTNLLKALVEEGEDDLVREYVEEVEFVPKTKKADQLLIYFQISHRHLAVVLDEYGGVAGVITLEDVLEVLTGQIMDETDLVADLQEEARRRRKNRVSKNLIQKELSKKTDDEKPTAV